MARRITQCSCGMGGVTKQAKVLFISLQEQWLVQSACDLFMTLVRSLCSSSVSKDALAFLPLIEEFSIRQDTEFSFVSSASILAAIMNDQTTNVLEPYRP